jgi:uncharacterized protein (TIGR00369 family)
MTDPNSFESTGDSRCGCWCHWLSPSSRSCRSGEQAAVERGTIELAFAATEAFTNPTGNVLGAFLAAMLYDTAGPALLATLPPDQFQSTLDLKVNFLRPVRPGRIVGRGRVVRRDGDIALLEASLVDANQATIATATATARVIPLQEARTAV